MNPPAIDRCQKRARMWSFLFVGVLMTVLGVTLMAVNGAGLPVFLYGIVAGLNYGFSIAEWRDG